MVARNRGVPTVAGCEALELHEDTAQMHGHIIHKGDWLSLDGWKGKVFIGRTPLTETTLSRHLDTLLSWCDQERTLSIRAFADTVEEVRQARRLDLPVAISTERMFTGANLSLMQEAILVTSHEQQDHVLGKLMQQQREQFTHIFRLAEGSPVIIRLLDPPLHEFLPAAHQFPADHPHRARIQQLQQHNPLFGHRGCRLMATHPHLYRLQVQVIFAAALDVQREGMPVHPHILLPLITTAAEFRSVWQLIDRGLLTTHMPRKAPWLMLLAP